MVEALDTSLAEEHSELGAHSGPRAVGRNAVEQATRAMSALGKPSQSPLLARDGGAGGDAGGDADDDALLENETVYVVHLESLHVDTPVGTPPRRELVMSIVEKDIEEVHPPTSPSANPAPSPQMGTESWHPEAEATMVADSVLQDSFQLDLPEDQVESRLARVRAELRNDFDIEEIEEGVDVEQLLDREYEKHESAFYLVDLGTIVRKYEQWVTLLPKVQPFYAVKSNPDVAIVRALKALGTGFDCASQAELELVLRLGVRPDDIIFANPCKMPAHIMYAKQHGVRKMTLDNLDELTKIHSLYPDAELILRLLPPDASSAVCNFGSKFGASPRMIRRVLKAAAKLGANLRGVSFHVGSGCWEPSAYELALQLAADVCKSASELGFQLQYVDIGGGYPAADNLDTPSFPEICAALTPALERLFPSESGVKIIAEPGRYMCGEAVVLAVNVIAKRTKVQAESTVFGDDDDEDESAGSSGLEVKSGNAEKDVQEEHDDDEEEQVLYYLSDGVYGSFNNIMFDHQNPVPKLSGRARCSAEEQGGRSRKSTLFGPTCDSIDVICRDVKLPDLDIGSWLYFLNMGAYTMAAASSFNGFPVPKCKYIITPGRI